MSKVSRKVYQKKSEECKRLMSDLKTIVMCDKTLSDEAKQVFTKWRKHFKKEQKFNILMKECATKYISENPEQFKFLNEGKTVRKDICPYCKSDRIGKLSHLKCCYECQGTWTNDL